MNNAMRTVAFPRVVNVTICVGWRSGVFPRSSSTTLMVVPTARLRYGRTAARLKMSRSVPATRWLSTTATYTLGC